MKNVFFNKELLEAEKIIIEKLNIPSLILMENAGKGAAGYITDFCKKKSVKNIILLTGKGNNAGDGFVIARHLLINEINLTLLQLYPESELKGDALTNYNILKNLNNKRINVINYENLNAVKSLLSPESLIIDAVFGIGYKGELEEKIKLLFDEINKLECKYIISVDAISGLDDFMDCQDCLNADVTLTMGVQKFNSLFLDGRKKSGKIDIIDIGIPAAEFTRFNTKKIFEVEKDDVSKNIPLRDINSHKYNNGRLFVLGGSPGLSGAVYMASLSALKTGSGAVILGVPQCLADIMEIKTTEVITTSYKQTDENTLSILDYQEIKKRIEWSDAVLIGPGSGKNEETFALVRKIISLNDKYFVVDADAVQAFKNHSDVLKQNDKKIILTPHYGEFSALTGIPLDEIKKNLYDVSTDFAKKYSVILVLKNSPTIITDGEIFLINPTGKENLATIGSGDVLSGIIASLLSQSGKPLESAFAGCYIHGKCGDNLYEKSGQSSTAASELIEEIEKVKLDLLN
ncbi:MAG: NAD(P)H-hydrate dehydratase [Ignavibacteria bacterium]|nr:NAD(P)H-hydrate dehydratase [Ignavibacteria bacterium]